MARPLGGDDSILRPVLQCAGETYVALAAATAVGVLGTSGAGAVAVVPTVMLLPVALLFAYEATRSAAAARCRWRAQRERADVGHRLSALGKAYRVLPSLAVSPGREDHVVVGPNGIFVVMTCGGGGRVTASAQRLFIDGRPSVRDLLAECRIDAWRVRERVRDVVGRPLPVHALVCFARGLVAVGQEIAGVQVVHAARLARLIASMPTPTPLARPDIDAAVLALVEAREVTPNAPVRARRPRPGERRLALVGRAPV